MIFHILISFVETPFLISFKYCKYPKNKHISSAQAIKRNFSFIPTSSRATAVTAEQLRQRRRFRSPHSPSCLFFDLWAPHNTLTNNDTTICMYDTQQRSPGRLPKLWMGTRAECDQRCATNEHKHKGHGGVWLAGGQAGRRAG